MTISYQRDVQDLISRSVEITYDEFTSGTALNAIKLPDNATVVDGTYWVLTAFDSGTSDAVTVTFNGLTLINDTDAQAKVRTAFTMPTTTEADVDKVSVSTPTWVQATLTSVGTAATAGKIRIEVRYYVRGRAFVQQS